MAESPMQYVREHTSEIVEMWQELLRREIEPAEDQPAPALVDSLPNFLHKLADLLEAADQPLPLADRMSISREHGKQRALVTRFSLPQVLNEYSLLRRVLLDLLEDRVGLSRRDRNLILNIIDAAMRSAATAFYAEKTAIDRLGRQSAEDQVKKLEAEQGLRERFVSTLSHDLRNPIGSVKMALDLLQVELGNSKFKELTDIMDRNVAKAEALIVDLLDANRIRSGAKLPLNVQFCDLWQTVDNAMTDLEATHGKRFVVIGDKNVIGYWCASQIQRAVENLASNAVKYGCPLSPVEVKLAAGTTVVTIEVHNQGNPVPSDEHKTLFDPYFRSKTAEATKAKGWGLGLTLVKGVAEAHGGSVSVKSDAVHGTTFTMTLPVDARPHQKANELN